MTARCDRSHGAMRTLLAALALVFVVSGATFAADAPSVEFAGAEKKYDLRYKLSTGDVVRFEVRHRASVRTTIDEATQSAQTKTDSVKTWRVTDVLPDGRIEFINVVERVKMTNQLPGRDPVEYDSEREETPPPGFEQAAQAVGVPLSAVRMTPRGELIERQVKHRGQEIADDAPIVVRLPDEPVAIGATWDEPFEVTVSLEAGGTKPIQTRRRYKLTDVKSGVATIDVAYLVLTPVDSHIEAQLIQRLMNGTVRFDIDAGRLIGQQMEVDKRVLGFAGPTSSMHYVMRMEEKLVEVVPKVVEQPRPNQPRAAQPQRSANRRPAQSSNRNQRR